MIRRWDKSRPPSGPFALNRDCPQAQGLVAWWPLGGASGKVFVPDLSGKHHLAPGTAPGSVTLGNDGRPALSFVAASSQYLTVGTAPVDAVPLTLTAWGKADSSTQTPIYIGGVANDNFFRIVLVSGKVRANCGTLTGPTQANAITSASYTTGAWQLFGATFASTSSRTVYLNGGNSVNETTSISPTAVNTRVFVGTGITVADAILQPWNGDLGETGVWNVALSADMHARLYNEGTRYELWYPLRSRKWMMPAAGGSTDLTVAEALHAHAADNVVLTSQTAITVAEALHAHAADNVVLEIAGATNLSVADALHAHAADTVVLTSQIAIVVADAGHAHTADGLTLTAASVLALQDALHAHAADNLTLELSDGISLTLADALHAHTADGVLLTVSAYLVVSDALHAHTADNILLSIPGAFRAGNPRVWILDSRQRHTLVDSRLRVVHLH